jgi:hypothetical protein
MDFRSVIEFIKHAAHDCTLQITVTHRIVSPVCYSLHYCCLVAASMPSACLWQGQSKIVPVLN